MILKELLRAALLAGLALAPAGARAQQAGPVATLTLSEAGGVPISPYLYGINYDWNHVPEDRFQAFAQAMIQVAHVTLFRYPAGWDAENYDWANNTESGKRAPASPGAPPQMLLAAAPAASFITPSEQAVGDTANIGQVVQTSTQLVAKYGAAVPVWEIGNEWWLQWGAKKDAATRARNLRNYGALLAQVVPAIKAKDPSIKVFATLDWTSPGDTAALRQFTGPAAWAQIDGISIHTYCGNTDPDRLCTALPARMAAIRAASGKDLLYASEWAVAKRLSAPDDFGIRNAGYTIAALGDMALAGITYGAYWPPVKVLPSIAFTSANYATPFATGIAFGWMSQYYEGTALHVSGPLPAVAARKGDATTVIVPADATPSHVVRIALAGTGLTKVTDAQVMYSAAPDDPKKGSRLVDIVPLPTTMGQDAEGAPYVQFVLNPGTPDRGTAFEIARVTLQ